jgi:hypothetical protein
VRQIKGKYMEKESSDINEKGKFMAKNVFHFKQKKLKSERTKQNRKQQTMTRRMREGP